MARGSGDSRLATTNYLLTNEENMKVLVLKLISGDEVLAEKSDKDVEGAVCVNRPRIMHLEPTPNGMKATLIPYVLSDADGKNIEVRLNALACNPIEASSDITKSYTQAVSGLTLING